MERKIGEIFKYNGEWYQCLIGNRCRECDFSSNNITCDIHGTLICTCKGRSDETSVVFKKLEKVGEPYIIGNKLIQRYKIYPTTYNIDVYGWYYHNLDVKSWTIDLEIKQNKEDMEEKKVIIGELAYKYINGKITYEAFEKGIKELCDNKEESKPTLKEFDLEAARSGKPVCTRDGRKARIICFDREGEGRSIIALVYNRESNIETCVPYFPDGRFYKNADDEDDLMMLPEKKEGWVNV